MTRKSCYILTMFVVYTCSCYMVAEVNGKQGNGNSRKANICKWEIDSETFDICSRSLRCEDEMALSIESVESNNTLCNGSSQCPLCCNSELITDPTLTGIIQQRCNRKQQCDIDETVVAGQVTIIYYCQSLPPDRSSGLDSIGSNRNCTLCGQYETSSPSDMTDMTIVIGVSSLIGLTCVVLVLQAITSKCKKCTAVQRNEDPGNSEVEPAKPCDTIHVDSDRTNRYYENITDENPVNNEAEPVKPRDTIHVDNGRTDRFYENVPDLSSGGSVYCEIQDSYLEPISSFHAK